MVPEQGRVRRRPRCGGRTADAPRGRLARRRRAPGSGGVTALIGWDPERMLVVEGNEDAGPRRRCAPTGSTARAAVDRPAAARRRCGRRRLPARRDRARRGPAPGAARGGAGARARRAAHRQRARAHVALELGRRVPRPRPPLHEADAARATSTRPGSDRSSLTHVFSWLVLPVWLKRRLHERPAGRARPRPDVAAARPGGDGARPGSSAG